MLYSALSRVRLFATAWAVAHQAPLSMNLLGKSTGVGCYFSPLEDQTFLARFDPRQGSNLLLLNLLSWQEDSLQLSHLGSLYLITLYINECVCVVLVAQSYPILCDPIDCRPPGSSVHGILQATILEWVAIPFFRGSTAQLHSSHTLAK